MRVEYVVPDLPFENGGNEFSERFFQALDEISGQGSDFVETAHEETATQIKTRFSDDEEASHIQIWEDFVGKVRYFELASEDERMLQTMRTALGKHFSFLVHADVLATARRDSATDPSIFYRVAYSAPSDFSQETFNVIRDGLEAQQEPVRTAAAAAAGLLGWAEFLPVLVERERAEPPGMAKRSMQDALRVFGVGR